MILLTGFVSGLAMVTPIGPVSLTLLGLGADRGRRAALRGAGGVVTADLVLLPLALLATGSVQGLDPLLVRGLELSLGGLLLALAAVGLARPEAARRAITGIRRPGRTLFAVNLCNPMALATWVGLVFALPDSLRAGGSLGAFFLGIFLASAAWHSLLALAGGWFEPRLGARGHRRMVRVGAGMLVLIAGVLLVG